MNVGGLWPRARMELSLLRDRMRFQFRISLLCPIRSDAALNQNAAVALRQLGRRQALEGGVQCRENCIDCSIEKTRVENLMSNMPCRMRISLDPLGFASATLG
jgi:hypothetical protein